MFEQLIVVLSAAACLATAAFFHTGDYRIAALLGCSYIVTIAFLVGQFTDVSEEIRRAGARRS